VETGVQSVVSRSWRFGAAPRAALRLAARGARCLERARQRRSLADLDDRRLRDLGLSRADVEREAAKPFWRP